VVARAMQWDAETLARFLEGEGRGLVATAGVVRREGISGFVFGCLGSNPEAVRRLGVGLGELAKLRPLLSTVFDPRKWRLRGRYPAFLSHYKKEAGECATILKDRLTPLLGCEPFLDSDNLQNLGELVALVKQSDTLVLLLTENVLTRPWCLVELYTALKHAVPVVTVEITKRGYGYDFGQAGPYLAGLPGTLEAANPGATEVIRGAGIDLGDLSDTLRGANLPHIISREFSPHRTDAVMRSEAEDIVEAMRSAVRD